MQFGSVLFCIFVSVTLLLFSVSPARFRWCVLLVSSYLFCAWSGSALHLSVLAGLTVWVYVIARGIDGSEIRATKRIVLAVGLFTIAGVLVLFRTTARLFPASVLLGVPLGLSFYSLKLLSYLVDVFRTPGTAERHLGRFATYVSLFPEMPAGPIDRAGRLLDQLSRLGGFRYESGVAGVQLFVWGLLRKVVLADRIKPIVDAVFERPDRFDGVAYAVATILFGCQIYLDFSAYSDMALGLGEMFGLKLTLNFDRPYHARSISQFWTRWHMSLSSWLRDYLFLPMFYRLDRLLESRLPDSVSADKLAYGIATAATMAICGLWHGFAWSYLVWGLVVAGYLVGSVFTRRLRTRLTKRVWGGRFHRVHHALNVLTTFLLMSLSWVFFRAPSVGQAIHMLARIPGDSWAYLCRVGHVLATGHVAGGGLTVPLLLGNPFDLLVILVGLSVVAGVELLQYGGSVRRRLRELPVWVRWPVYVAAVTTIVVLRVPTTSFFIYEGF